MPRFESANSRMPEGTAVQLTWLGQAGFLLEGSGARVLIDPWFSDHERRTAPAPLVSDLPADIGWVLATHGHTDHLDVAGIGQLHDRMPGIRVVVPGPLAERVSAAAVPVEVRAVQPGDRIADGRLVIEVVPAWHGVTVEDGYSAGPQDGPTPHVGYVIRLGEVSVYHAGDTIASAHLIDVVRDARVDVCLLPINGRDHFREATGILGNLDAAEAAQLAAAVGARILIPMHYDMVEGNTAPAGGVVDAVARLGLALHVVVPTRGAPLRLDVRRP